MSVEPFLKAISRYTTSKPLPPHFGSLMTRGILIKLRFDWGEGGGGGRWWPSRIDFFLLRSWIRNITRINRVGGCQVARQKSSISPITQPRVSAWWLWCRCLQSSPITSPLLYQAPPFPFNSHHPTHPTLLLLGLSYCFVGGMQRPQALM